MRGVILLAILTTAICLAEATATVSLSKLYMAALKYVYKWPYCYDHLVL